MPRDPSSFAPAAPAVPAPRGQGTADALTTLLAAELGGIPRRVVSAEQQLPGADSGSLDAVRCGEDVLPRRAADASLPGFLRAAFTALRSGGVFAAFVPSFAGRKPKTTPPRVLERDGTRELITSVWNWAGDGRSYTVEVLRLRESGNGWQIVDCSSAMHRVLVEAEVDTELRAAGLTKVRMLPTTRTGLQAPLWLGVRP